MSLGSDALVSLEKGGKLTSTISAPPLRAKTGTTDRSPKRVVSKQRILGFVRMIGNVLTIIVNVKRIEIEELRRQLL